MPWVTRREEHLFVGDDHDEFADTLRQYETSPDEFSLLSAHIATCERTLEALRELDVDDSNFQTSAEAAQIPQWELELRCWRLVEALLGSRVDRSPNEEEVVVVHRYSSDYQHLAAAFAKDHDLAEVLRVKSWLEETAGEFYPVETRKGYWQYTSRKAERKRKGFLQDESVPDLDPDGPTRTNAPLAPEDQTYDESLTKTMFEYHRRGRLADAMQLCRDCDQPWRAASVAGALYWRDPFMDGTGDDEGDFGGNPNRDLWKFTCHQIAQEKSFSLYERALYATLCGDIPNALPVCRVWEDYVWVYYNALAEDLTHKKLAAIPHDKTFADEETIYLPTSVDVKKPAEIFDSLARHERADIRSAALNPFRAIQTMWILDVLDDLFAHIRYKIEDGSIQFFPHVLRFAVHFILVLRFVSYPLQSKDHCDFIIKTYIDLLIAAEKHRHVAVFCTQLPSLLQIECYSDMLQTVTGDKDTRREYYLQAKSTGLPVHMIAVRTVEKILAHGISQEKVAPNVLSVFFAQTTDPVPASDMEQIRALEWLTFSPELQPYLMTTLNTLTRRFLVFGRLQSVEHLHLVNLKHDGVAVIPDQWRLIVSTMDHDQIRGLQDPPPPLNHTWGMIALGIYEHTLYQMLMASAKKHAQWVALMRGRPARLRGDKMSFQEKDWIDEVKVMSRSAEEDLLRMLSQTGFILPDSIDGISAAEEQVVRDEFEFLRTLYIPQAFFWLHQILFDTRAIIPGNLQRCLELRKLVDDSEDGFQGVFIKSGRLPQLVAVLQEAEKASAEEGHNA